MSPRTISLFAIITLYLALIQRIAGQSDNLPDNLPGSSSTHKSDCTSDQIQKGNLKDCICHGSDHECDNKCPATPPNAKCTATGKALESQVHLQNCAETCTGEHNHCCSGCWIWFQAVCDCVQSLQTGVGVCLQGSTPSTYWLKLNTKLASTNVLIPNILDLQKFHQPQAIDAWDFGQGKASDPKTQALAINSAHSITENQIHMHICDLNKKMKQDLTDLYTAHSKTPTFYSALTEIKDIPLAGERMFCRAAQQANQAIPGFTISADINTVLGRTDTCDYFVGAAVIVDNNGFTWSCVTADNESTEVKRFCA